MICGFGGHSIVHSIHEHGQNSELEIHNFNDLYTSSKCLNNLSHGDKAMFDNSQSKRAIN